MPGTWVKQTWQFNPVLDAPPAVTGRVKAAIYDGIEQLVNAGVLLPLTASKRNRSWEASGLLELIERLEAGELPV